MSRVSVIIPTYNGDQFIAEAIESVLNQTYSDLELIVVDDGSQDATVPILQSYQNQIHCFVQPNQGVAAARNRGLQMATGEFVAFLDQDDVFLPDKLACQVSRLENYPDLGLVNSGWQIVDQQGQVLSAVRPWCGRLQLDLETWIVWKPIFLGAMLFRRSCLNQVGGFNSQWHQVGDVDMVLRMVLDGCRGEWLQQETVCYRQHDRNASRNALQQAEELQCVLDMLFGRSDLPESVKRLERRSRYQSLVWSAWRLYRTSYFTEMATYLEKSLEHQEGTWTETILDWLSVFKCYQREYEGADVLDVVKLQEWQELVRRSARLNIAF